jgi:hypothetical protein
VQNIKQHIAFRTATLLLVFTLVLPSVVKFSHVFEHHQHEVCNGEITTHLHNQDVDCEFYKFKLATSFTIPDYNVDIFQPQHTYLKSDSHYDFLSDYQRLHFSLRGPPQINLI